MTLTVRQIRERNAERNRRFRERQRRRQAELMERVAYLDRVIASADEAAASGDFIAALGILKEAARKTGDEISPAELREHDVPVVEAEP